MLRIRCLGAASFAAVLAAFSTANADDYEDIKIAYAGVEEITVFASAGGIANVPGAITYIDAEDIERHSYADILRTLRLVPRRQHPGRRRLRAAPQYRLARIRL